MKIRELVSLLVIVLLCSPVLRSQKISGKVYFAKDSSEVFNAHIYLKGTSFGTTSNAEGLFSLHLNSSIVEDTLVCSYVGYKLYQQSLVPNEDSKISIFLVEDNSMLADVIVSVIDAKEIIGRVRDNIRKNYPKNFNTYDILYREVIQNDNEFTSYLEIAADITMKGFSKEKVNLDEYKEIRFRNRRLSQKNIDRSIDPRIGIDGIYVISKVNSIRLDISDQYFDSYVFEYEGTTTYEGRDVYIISIRVPDLPNKDFVYVTMDTYAIVSSHYEEDWDINDVPIREGKSEGPPFHKVIIHADFHEVDGLWYLSYIRDYRYKLYSGDSTQSADRTLRVLNIGKKEKLVGSLKMNLMHDLYNHPIPYDPYFWKNYNAPLETEAEKKIKDELEKNNIQFKSRPEPVNSHEN